MSLIKVEGLTKTRKNIVVVDQIDLTINQGEVLGLLGPNGAGKSTTISMLTSIVEPTDGIIYYKDNPLPAVKSTVRRKIGYVPQEIALYPEFTGYENLTFFAKVYQLPRSQMKSRIEEVLEIVGLQEKAKERVHTYSGGMQRRLNIAAGMLHQPELLIMDEPTVGIDPQSRNYILEVVKRLNKQGMTILYTSHYMEEVEYLCDRIAIMDKGKIIAMGSKEELISMIQHQDILAIEIQHFSQLFFEALDKLNEVDKLEQSDNTITIKLKSDAKLLPQIFSLAETYELTILSVDLKTPRLEDVFLHLTGKKLRDE